MKVAIYARISTDNLGQDVDRQLHEVRAYCERMEYEVVEEYVDEGFARTTRNRPSLDKLIKDARQRKFKLVVSDDRIQLLLERKACVGMKIITYLYE